MPIQGHVETLALLRADRPSPSNVSYSCYRGGGLQPIIRDVELASPPSLRSH